MIQKMWNQPINYIKPKHTRKTVSQDKVFQRNFGAPSIRRPLNKFTPVPVHNTVSHYVYKPLHQGFLQWHTAVVRQIKEEMYSSKCRSQASAAVEQVSFTQPQESVVEESGSKLRVVNDMQEVSGTEQLISDHHDAAMQELSGTEQLIGDHQDAAMLELSGTEQLNGDHEDAGMQELSGTEQLVGDHEDTAENKENVPDSTSEENEVIWEDKNYYYSCHVKSDLHKLRTYTNVVQNYVKRNSVKEYICTLCDKLFSNRSNVNKHVKTKHLGLKFKCPLCPTSLSSKQGVMKHVSINHTVPLA